MTKSILKYHNDINKINFSTFSEKELNLFFSICFKLKDKGEKELTLSFQELKHLSLGDKNLPRFLKTLKSVYTKLISMSFEYTDENGFGGFVLFEKYYVNEKQKIVILRIGNDFLYLLNNLVGNYTKFDLMEFVSLKSSYSKNMFKLLKQWESIQNKKIEISNLRDYLGVPLTYDTNNFNKKVLKPIMLELPKYFYNFEVKKIKTNKTITHLYFSWETKKSFTLKTKKLEINESLNNALKKVKANRFLFEILTNENIYKLTKIYEEHQLKKELLYLEKTIKKPIPNLRYLIKILNSNIQKTKIEIISKNQNNIIENKQIIKIKKIENEELNFKKYLNMPQELQQKILQQAQTLYMKDVNISFMIPIHQKFFKAAKKKYILDILKNYREV